MGNLTQRDDTKNLENTIGNQFEQQWFIQPTRVYTAVWYKLKPFAIKKKGRSCQLLPSAPVTLSCQREGKALILKSLKIQNVLRPWNQKFSFRHEWFLSSASLKVRPRTVKRLMRVLFYPRKLLFAAMKEITILFSTHWQNLWKSGEKDWQTVGYDQKGRLWPGRLWPVGYEQEFIKDKSKSKNTRKASA